MSKTISVSTSISKSIEEVWKEVSILKNHTNWMKDAVSIEFLNEKSEGLGTKMKVLTKIGPIKLFDYMTVTEWIEKKSIGVDHIGIVTGKGKFTLNEISEEEFLDAVELKRALDKKKKKPIIEDEVPDNLDLEEEKLLLELMDTKKTIH